MNLEIIQISYELKEKRRSGVVSIVVGPRTENEVIAKAKEEIERSHPGHAYELHLPLMSESRLIFKEDGVCHHWSWH